MARSPKLVSPRTVGRDDPATPHRLPSSLRVPPFTRQNWERNEFELKQLPACEPV
jgi:hypothetical protein